MTDDRARKKAVRRRMAQTGEKYTEAQRALQDTSTNPETKRQRAEDPARREQFGRFTDYARRVLVLAREEARSLNNELVDTEHILIGLLRDKEDGIAARVLGSLEITIERVQANVGRYTSLGDRAVSRPSQFTPGAKQVLELALREALSLRHNYIGPEHILLGLALENNGLAARILRDFHADYSKLRNEVIRNLCGPGGRPSSIGTAESAQQQSRGVFTHFTDRAREALELAQRESRELGHERTGSEHVLLGLLREREGLAGRALEALDVTLEQVRAKVLERVPRSAPATTDQRPFTPRAKRILELSLREALSLGHNYSGTEHLLLALVRERNSTASAVLLELDADSQKVRNEIRARLAKTAVDPPTERSQPERLTAQEEVELAKRIERGDPEAKEQLAEASSHLVVSIADEYRGQRLSLEELQRAGTRGLVRAIDNFDYRLGHRFSSYATQWIRQAVVRVLPTQGQ